MATKTPTKRKTKTKAAPAARGTATPSKKSAPAPRSRGRLSNTTIDHEEIQRWAEARDATPAKVKGTGKKNDPGIIRLDLPGFSGEDSLEEISWEDFFEAFDANNLALVYQDKTAAGKRSNFNKFVSRDTVKQK